MRLLCLSKGIRLGLDEAWGAYNKEKYDGAYEKLSIHLGKFKHIFSKGQA